MKKLVSLLLVLTMVLALAACGSSGSTATTAAPTAETTKAGEKVTVTIITAQYGKQTTQWWADFASKFNAEHDDIEVVVDCVSWNDIYTVVNTRVANGEAPDLLNIDVFADFQAPTGFPRRPTPSSTPPSWSSPLLTAPFGLCPIWLPPALCTTTRTSWTLPT